jgi:hypothetical protein
MYVHNKGWVAFATHEKYAVALITKIFTDLICTSELVLKIKS